MATSSSSTLSTSKVMTHIDNGTTVTNDNDTPLDQRIKMLDDYITQYYHVSHINIAGNQQGSQKCSGPTVEFLPISHAKITALRQNNESDKTSELEKIIIEQRSIIIELSKRMIKQNDIISELNTKNQQLNLVLSVLRCL